MKKIVLSILTLLLTIGIIFITTDCEVYFRIINHSAGSAAIPVDRNSDVEHTHAAHHTVNDLYSEKIEETTQKEAILLLDIGIRTRSLRHYNFTTIWQPPKFS
jgi:uncharacterized membrane protein